MKKISGRCARCMVVILSITFILGLPRQGNAQENSNLFALVDLMKVEQGNDSKYIDIERNLWKPIHQERVNKGNIVGWMMFRIWFKGAKDDYNYATVTLFDNPAHLENPYEGIQFTEVHSDMDMDDFLEKTMDSRVLVQSRFIRMVNSAYPDGVNVGPPFKYLVMNYMKPLPGSNFLNFENEMAKPIHKELVKSGEWAGWSVWSNIFPRGENVPHQYVTIDLFSDFTKIGSANYIKAFEKAHPDKDWSEFIEGIGKSHEMVLSELWEVIDVVMRE